MTEIKKLSAETLKQIAADGGTIVDVRSSMEHNEKRLKCTHILVPLNELKPDDFLAQNGLDKNSTLYLLCRSGGRATQAAEKFAAAGCTNVHVIEGGITACEACGHEVEDYTSQGTACGCTNVRAPISLERQVRIAAGAMTAIGALLALTVNVGFGVIPLFIGCGLVFAGVTDRCGLALVLTRAPWNKTTLP